MFMTKAEAWKYENTVTCGFCKDWIDPNECDENSELLDWIGDEKDADYELCDRTDELHVCYDCAKELKVEMEARKSNWDEVAEGMAWPYK